MEDNYSDKGKTGHSANAEVMQELKDYISRVCIALINRELLDKNKLSEAFEKQESVDAFNTFICSAESSIMFIEDSTSIGGEGIKNSSPSFLNLIVLEMLSYKTKCLSHRSICKERRHQTPFGDIKLDRFAVHGFRESLQRAFAVPETNRKPDPGLNAVPRGRQQWRRRSMVILHTAPAAHQAFICTSGACCRSEH